ncbi:MAG: hypothetical protein DMD67_09605 [Gemmatimonadetes bacterium]|nr:MAG: hypothetical protein DMD67_09605 [Gemmatimonadota bacterium]
MGIIRQRRKAETRAMLLQAGLAVVAERGIELATLDEVAVAAGFTKGAIYRQFPSKSALPERARPRGSSLSRSSSRRTPCGIRS